MMTCKTLQTLFYSLKGDEIDQLIGDREESNAEIELRYYIAKILLHHKDGFSGSELKGDGI
jgi:hypothetical protein